MTKEIIREALDELPNEFTLDELMERLILLQSFEQGKQQYREGQTLTHEEVGQRLDKWLK